MTQTNNTNGDNTMLANFAAQFENIVGIESRAFCVTDESGFVSASDFHAMAINFEMEREMLNFELDLQAEQNAWYDELEAANHASDMMELGLTM